MIPSPQSVASSCHSSDDEVTRGLKRMKIGQFSSRASSFDIDKGEYFHKEIRDMVLVDVTAEKRRIEDARKAHMLQTLRNQMKQYQSQYASITQDLHVTDCMD